MDSILKVLELSRVFSVEISRDKKDATFYEECDMNFSAILTKPQVQQLINELQVIHDQMIY